jgi:hypothetical protein
MKETAVSTTTAPSQSEPIMIYRPDGPLGRPSITLSPSPPSLSGLRIAVLDNGKPNTLLVLSRLAETLSSRTGATVSLVTKKGPQGMSANAAIPCAPDIFDRVVAEADLVITGMADCGSCTAYSVHDTIEFEKVGRPAVVVTTTRFEPITETLATNFGLPGIRRLVLPHPVGGTDPDTLHQWADAAVDRLITLYSA